MSKIVINTDGLDSLVKSALQQLRKDGKPNGHLDVTLAMEYLCQMFNTAVAKELAETGYEPKTMFNRDGDMQIRIRSTKYDLKK